MHCDHATADVAKQRPRARIATIGREPVCGPVRPTSQDLPAPHARPTLLMDRALTCPELPSVRQACCMDKSDRTARTQYDLYIRDGSATFYFRNDNHGVTLTARRIADSTSVDSRNACTATGTVPRQLTLNV